MQRNTYEPYIEPCILAAFDNIRETVGDIRDRAELLESSICTLEEQIDSICDPDLAKLPDMSEFSHQLRSIIEVIERSY